MDNRAIGVFDSGLGGLTCVRELAQLLPGEKVIYFGDTGRVPYGSRSEETIKKYVRQDINFLLSHPVKMVVAACGTASAVALDDMAQSFDVPVAGVVEPAVEAAYKATKSGRIGVIGTSGTVKNGKYSELLKSKDASLYVCSKACPIFVPLVENGFAEHEMAYLACKEYLKDIKEQNVDTLILGCTHYPIMKNAVAKFMGNDVTLIDPGACLAHYVKAYLESNNMLSSVEQSENEYYVSDVPADFEKTAGLFLGCNIGGCVKKTDIEKY